MARKSPADVTVVGLPATTQFTPAPSAPYAARLDSSATRCSDSCNDCSDTTN